MVLRHSHVFQLPDYALALCRKHRLTKNDRSVFLTTEETLLKISLILGRLEKEAYGAEELLVSDVLDVFAKVNYSSGEFGKKCNVFVAKK